MLTYYRTDTDNRPPYSPYVEISLDNVLHNIGRIRSLLPPDTGVIAVVKDCSYGNGGALIARTLEHEGGVGFFAVARPREAAALRKSGIASPILVLGMATEDELRYGAENKILFALNDLSDIERWKSYRISIDCHVNIDTGMSRVGILPQEAAQLAGALKDASGVSGVRGVRLDGVFTHMACADEPGTASVGKQLEIFAAALDKIYEAGLSPSCIHYGNSAASIRFPAGGSITGGRECRLYVRPGVALYGCKPDPAQDFGIDLKPVASLKSRVVKMKKVPAGTPVSYGWNYRTSAGTWIATIPAGYAHGLPRFLSGKGEVLIGGKRYRIAGNVTMDYIMTDAGPNPTVSVGDEVTVIGYQGDEVITADDIALAGNTIGYEIICNLGTSIDRYYLRNGEIVHHDPGVIF